MSHQSIEECVASKRIQREMKALHLVENLHGKVGLLGLDIGTNGGVKKGFGSKASQVEEEEEELVELVVVVAVGGDEGDEEGLGIGEFAVGEEGREERERREWGEEVREFENSQIEISLKQNPERTRDLHPSSDDDVIHTATSRTTSCIFTVPFLEPSSK